MILKENLTGIILAGGKSSRMGKNKALLSWEETSLAGYVANSMRPFCLDVIISGDPEILSALPEKKIPDSIPDSGPVGGIFSCLQKIQTPLAIIAPCDMPFLSPSLFSFLISSWTESDRLLCFVHKSKAQPLLGIFRKEDAKRIGELLNSGEKRAWKIVEQLGVRFIEFPETMKGLVDEPELNVNSPSQYFYALNKKNKMIRLLFFGSLAEKAGGREISLPVTTDLNSLKTELKSKYPTLDLNAVIIAINQNIVNANCTISPGDEIAFMPPFAGG